MSDTAQVIMSWIIIFMTFLFALLMGFFIGKSSRLSSYHAQINPIIERYGGTSNIDEYKDGHTAQTEIERVSKRMNHDGIKFTVSPTTTDSSSRGDNHSTDVASFGQPVSYSVHVQVPYGLGLVMNEDPVYYTTSKVGVEN